jgi:hypothetical protein
MNLINANGGASVDATGTAGAGGSLSFFTDLTSSGIFLYGGDGGGGQGGAGGTLTAGGFFFSTIDAHGGDSGAAFNGGKGGSATLNNGSTGTGGHLGISVNGGNAAGAGVGGAGGHITLGGMLTASGYLLVNGGTGGGGSGANGALNMTDIVRVNSLGVNNSASATTPGSVVKKIEVFDAGGTSLGFIPVYNTIT